MIELLAPAGNEECFFAAVNNGADAVYMGLSDFSARKNAGNFTKENISYYIAYAHIFGVKVYIAVNTLIKNREIDEFLSVIGTAYVAGADAFIVQDVFIGKLLKRKFDGITLHLSTQGGINNVEGAEYAVGCGFSRVILARETAIEEIRLIADVAETEIFVHGALCSSFSGHCYMSSFAGGNSGNRGLCKQPCRRAYTLESSDVCGKYAISLSDLCLSDKLSELKAAGVKSIKIEGRMRTPEYVAATVKTYRAALDGRTVDICEIKRTFNRGDYTPGYVFGVADNIISSRIQNNKGAKIGTVTKILSGNRILVDSDENFIVGDGFKIIDDGYEVGNAVCTEYGKILKYRGRVNVGNIVNITKDIALTEKLLSEKKKKHIDVSVYAVAGTKLKAESGNIKIESENVSEKARTRAITIEEIRENFSKTDIYPFTPTISASVDGNPFIVKSAINAVRTQLYKTIFYGNNRRPAYIVSETAFPVIKIKNKYNRIYISDEVFNVGNGNVLVYFPGNYDIIRHTIYNAYLYIPAFLTERDIRKIADYAAYFKGFYVDGLVGLQMAVKLNKAFIVGTGLNVFNSFDYESLITSGADAVVYSKELSADEIADIGSSGYVFTRGNVRLMELLYCPYGRNCKKCDRNDFNRLTDELGHEFTIRRYRINGRCRFEVYNGSLLNYNVDKNFGEVINLVGLNKEVKEKIINNIPVVGIKTFSGDLIRGVY